MTQVGFFIDVTKCIGCKTCVVSCKDKNNLEVGRNFRRVYSFEQGVFPNPSLTHVSLSCNHCDVPTCIPNCPTTAIFKREKDGVVLIDHDKCVGCRYCEWNCPYEAPQFNEQLGKMTKCDTCFDLRDAGEEPVCVTSCPLRAIEFGPIEELREKYGTVSEVPGMPSSSITQPNLVMKLK